jgi:hypothetical protein
VKATAALIWVLAIPAALLCGVLAFVLSPDAGLFGDTNSSLERVIGVLCALATGPLAVAGLLYVGVQRHDTSIVVPAGLVAATVSVAVLVAAG